MDELTIIGGGLAGCEAAWQAAENGIQVTLMEMRPGVSTGAHTGGDLAELICSNSLGSSLPDRPSGLLKEELRQLDSLLLECAEACGVPAGAALAVDRQAFARMVTRRISEHPRIRLVRAECTQIPAGPTIIASGPLTSPALTAAIQQLTHQDHLFFYDAIAPVVYADSINMEIAYRASRYGNGQQEGGDYINCPFFDREEYNRFVAALVAAERFQLREFEEDIRRGVRAGMHTYFEGCLPVEIIASRGIDSLAYGPMRPAGLRDPRTGQRPFALLQLRQDNLHGTLYNLVGFQTNLTFPEQKRIFRLIPGLEQAEFARFGQMHRNTFIASPLLLNPTMQFRARSNIFFAGQITGVEGYMGNIATGLLAGRNMVRFLHGRPLLELPVGSMLGAMCHTITHAAMEDFQPVKANFGLLPPLPAGLRGRRPRVALHVQNARAAFQSWLAETPMND